jgi:hypothetical protein
MQFEKLAGGIPKGEAVYFEAVPVPDTPFVGALHFSIKGQVVVESDHCVPRSQHSISEYPVKFRWL